MARKMYEEAVTVLKYNDCYDKTILTLDRMITEYETFRSSKKVRKDCLRFLDSLVAGLKMLRIASKLQNKMIKVEVMDLHELKQLAIEAFKCREFPCALIISAEVLCAEFSTRKYFGIARVLLMVAKGGYAMLEKGDHLRRNNFLKDHRIIKIHQMNSTMLCFETKALRDLFDDSKLAILNDNFETEERASKEMIFDDLLDTIGLKDEYEDIPKIVRSFKQAEKLFNLLNTKLDLFELELERRDFAMAKACVIEMEVSCRYTRVSCFYNFSAFVKDEEKKFSLIEKSMEHCNLLLSTHFKKDILIKFTTCSRISHRYA